MPDKLILPADESSLDHWELKNMIRAAANKRLAGKDVSKGSAEADTALTEAISEVEGLIGSSVGDAFLKKLKEDILTSARYAAERAKKKSKTGMEEFTGGCPEEM